ncbi:MAG: NUDIX domain-containing protein [bacterium]
MKDDAQFYVGQKAFIRKGDQVLVLSHFDGGIDYPGGKIQEGEIDLAESLKREVREETGLEIEVGEAFTTRMHVFGDKHRLAGKNLFLVGYKCEYTSGEVKISHEHGGYAWVTKDNFLEKNDGSKHFEMLRKYFSL